MAYIAGVDVGNNTTEVAIAEANQQGEVSFLSSAIVRTVGIKGTMQNALGVIVALDTALKPLALQRKDLSLILLNEATPVIGDVAMETITETVITESAMIGHNPSTPGGLGLLFCQRSHLAQGPVGTVARPRSRRLAAPPAARAHRGWPCLRSRPHPCRHPNEGASCPPDGAALGERDRQAYGTRR